MSKDPDARLWKTLGDIQSTLIEQASLISRFSTALYDAEDRLARLAAHVGRSDLTRPSPQRIAEVEARVRELGEVEAQVRAARPRGEQP